MLQLNKYFKCNLFYIFKSNNVKTFKKRENAVKSQQKFVKNKKENKIDEICFCFALNHISQNGQNEKKSKKRE